MNGAAVIVAVRVTPSRRHGDNSYEFATDTFVVRNGKIVAQSFAAKINRKR
jgi:hypothetical protein